MADHPDPSVQADKPIPLGVALGVLGAIGVGGLGMICGYLYRRPAPARVMQTQVPSPASPRVAGGAVADERMRANVLRAAAEADLPDGVHPGAGGDVLFKAGDAYVKVTHPDGRVVAHFGFFALAEVEWEHGYLTQGVRRLTLQPDFARELGVSDDQVRRLLALPEAPPAMWPEADRARFVGLYEKWKSADEKSRTTIGTEAVAALAKYAAERRASNQRIIAERVAAIRSILDAKQQATINPIPRWDFGPATRRTSGK